MNIKPLIVLVLCMHFFTICAFDKIQYAFSDDPIDVVMPCHPKDAGNIDRAIKSIKQYVQNVRRIIVVSSKRFTDNAEWIDEKIFPFTKETIALEIFKSPKIATFELTKPQSRMGWIYQQLIKLYAAYCIPNISSNILIVDSDVVFLKPVQFLQQNRAGLYAVGTEFNKPYFNHAAQLLPNLKRLYPKHSGITHHMLFQKPVLDDLFAHIYKQHHLEPWIAILRAIPVTNNAIHGAALSEYEIYFNFVFARTDQVKIRPLNWRNLIERTTSLSSYEKQGYDYVALHVYE